MGWQRKRLGARDAAVTRRTHTNVSGTRRPRPYDRSSRNASWFAFLIKRTQKGTDEFSRGVASTPMQILHLSALQGVITTLTDFLIRSKAIDVLLNCHLQPEMVYTISWLLPDPSITQYVSVHDVGAYQGPENNSSEIGRPP